MQAAVVDGASEVWNEALAVAMRGRKRKRREECRTVRLTRGARERFRGTRMGTEEEAETGGRGEEHDLGGNREWEGPGSDEEEMGWEAMGIAFGDG